MSEIPSEAYDAGVMAVSQRTLAQDVDSTVVMSFVIISVDAVWPLAVEAGRKAAAEALRATFVAGTPAPKWAMTYRGTVRAADLAEWAARIAEGSHDDPA